MSVVIKGMKMPKECRDCPLEMYYMNSGDTRCRAKNKILAEDFKAIPFDGRPDWCPLVEVPAPHGRLIDADALIARMESDAEQMEEPIAQMFTYAAINDVKHSETVIEAERRTDETD